MEFFRIATSASVFVVPEGQASRLQHLPVHMIVSAGAGGGLGLTLHQLAHTGAKPDDLPGKVSLGGSPARLLNSIPNLRENHLGMWSDSRARVSRLGHLSC